MDNNTQCEEYSLRQLDSRTMAQTTSSEQLLLIKAHLRVPNWRRKKEGVHESHSFVTGENMVSVIKSEEEKIENFSNHFMGRH